MTEHFLGDGEKLIQKLLKIVEDRNELKDCIKILNCHISTNLDKCLCEIFKIKSLVSNTTLLEIESIIDYIEDEVNIGHWSKISLELRRTYTIASFVKMVLNLKFHKRNIEINILRELLKCLDRGLLMGAPLKNNCELLTKAATVISRCISKHFHKLSMIDVKPDGDMQLEHTCNQSPFLFGAIEAQELNPVMLPSLEHFNIYFTNQQPVKLKGCIDHWPARTKWKNIDYLLETAGDRTVPVEIGTQYVDENWSQKLMTLKEFIKKYYFNKENSIGYLAQHNLFDQIPELRDDICIPEYCSLSEDYDHSCDPDINCWFGPEGTVSSLHYDPKHNLLAQVYGSKQVLLFSPNDTQYLYPYEETLLNNTSQVDPIIPNLELYPYFKNATMYKCLLKEGEVLFIPKKWWHHVIALEKSFSVSFWWQ